MARPLRIEFPGAYYHVMNRGNHRDDIFITDSDRNIFLAGLANSCETFSVNLIAYVLMPNHFHLLLQTPQANLSEFMRHFSVTYTVRFNRRHNRTGHVFQGRFKSLLVQEDEYLLPLSRYIHLNPIRTRRFKNSNFKECTEYLKTYPWSSLPGYCYVRKRNKKFNYKWFLETYFGEDTAMGRKRYRKYVFRAIEGEIENPFDEVVHQSILGNQGFVDWVKDKLPGNGQREMPSLHKLQHEMPVETILEIVAADGKIEPGELRQRKTRAKELRQLAIEMCYRYSIHNQREIGAIFGVDYSTVSQNRNRLKAKLESNRKAKKQFNRIKGMILNVSKRKI